MIEHIIGGLLIAIGIAGVWLHVQSSLAVGRFVGTKHEFQFVVGTFMALIGLSAGALLLFS